MEVYDVLHYSNISKLKLTLYLVTELSIRWQVPYKKIGKLYILYEYHWEWRNMPTYTEFVVKIKI